jgi:hypothetical protein
MFWNSLASKQSFNRREALIVRVFFEFSSITLQKPICQRSAFLRSALSHRHAITWQLCNFSDSPTRSCQLRNSSPEHALGRKQRRHLVCYWCARLRFNLRKIDASSLGHLCGAEVLRRQQHDHPISRERHLALLRCSLLWCRVCVCCVYWNIFLSLLCVCVADRDIIGGGRRERERTHVFAANNKVPRRLVCIIWAEPDGNWRR